MEPMAGRRSWQLLPALKKGIHWILLGIDPTAVTGEVPPRQQTELHIILTQPLTFNSILQGISNSVKNDISSRRHIYYVEEA